MSVSLVLGQGDKTVIKITNFKTFHSFASQVGETKTFLLSHEALDLYYNYDCEIHGFLDQGFRYQGGA